MILGTSPGIKVIQPWGVTKLEEHGAINELDLVQIEQKNQRNSN
jgi:hypothetical protein